MPRVFISYVRENCDTVQRLVQALEARGVDVWFDQTHLEVGDRWPDVIRREIAEGDFFIACFSAELMNRTEGFVFEELTQAIERLRRRPTDKPWLLPVLLSDCEIPDRDIGAGATLRSIHHVELHKDWDEGIQRILQVVQPEPPSNFTNTLGMEFVLIPAGEFMMGSTPAEIDHVVQRSREGFRQYIEHEMPQHQARITQPFYLGKYAVTQQQWEAVMGENPSTFKGNVNWPVETVSWDDVQEFIQKLNAQESGTPYRLPTEAQWEYACRAGTDGPRYHENIDVIAWYDENSDAETHTVGQKLPNAWRLYDMLGNVWEWVQDWYDEEYYKNSPPRDPQGPDKGASRVFRGGGWGHDAQGCRAAFRNAGAPADRVDFLGFRLARSVALGS